CGGQQFSVTRVQPNVFLVIDRSGSMGDPISDSSNTSKWNDMKGAVSALVTGFDSQIRLGMSLFNSDGDCGAGKVDTALGPMNGATIDAELTATQPGGNTPTAATLAAIATGANLSDPTRDNIVVLATDGLPNCGDTDVAGKIDALYNMTPSVKTYVIGVGDGTSSDPDLLNSWAVAGHTDRSGGTKYYQSNSSADLQTAFQTIAGGIVSCTFALSSTPPDPTQLYVYLNQTPVAADPTNGFSYSDSPAQITLNGSACDTLKNDSTQKLGVVYGCPGQPPIN
ncbi:MAG: VWA domain-containing protein, partial [Polyangia bacterium]